MRRRSHILPGLLLGVGGAAALVHAETAAPPAAPSPLAPLAFFQGSWRCQAKAPAGPRGPAHEYRASVRVEPDLDGRFLAARYQEEPSAVHREPVRAVEYWGWDSVAARLVRSGFDTQAGQYRLTTAGWEGERLRWTGEAIYGGMRLQMRDTITRRGPAESSTLSEVQLPAGTWAAVGETLCRR